MGCTNEIFNDGVWVLLVAAVMLGSLGLDASATGRALFVAPSVAYYTPPPVWGYGAFIRCTSRRFRAMAF